MFRKKAIDEIKTYILYSVNFENRTGYE